MDGDRLSIDIEILFIFYMNISCMELIVLSATGKTDISKISGDITHLKGTFFEEKRCNGTLDILQSPGANQLFCQYGYVRVFKLQPGVIFKNKIDLTVINIQIF